MPTLSGPEPVAEQVNVSGAELTCWHLNPELGGAKPWLLMLHGMLDVGRSLLPVAWPLANDYRIVLVDLRGHGASAYPGTYSVYQYYFDILSIVEGLRARHPDAPLYLFGHSLGGQLAARFAGLFPELLDALVLAEGLGPPRLNWPATAQSEDDEVALLREQLRTRFERPAQLRPLPSLEFAAERLLANNPRLDPEQARLTARYGTTLAADGSRRWAFDPRVTTVFTGFREAESLQLWRQVTCPVLTITGDLSAEYWVNMAPADERYDGNFQPGEYEARISAFATVTHERFDGSGHMVHFDEPERLACALEDFLDR